MSSAPVPSPPPAAAGDALIETSGLTHRYGRQVAVDALDLEVRAGEVLGLLGHNGAGKTTTVKALLGLLKPQRGTCSVLGLPSWKRGVEVRRRTGYVPEDLTACDWMTVGQTLRFVSAFHPTWDRALEDDLVRRLELPREKKLRELSRGTLAKVHLACAVAFRPEALVLDDPTSGLDALVRREVLEQVIDLAADGGRAVLFSSHVLDEVERLADRVAIVVAGRKVLDRRVDELKRSFRTVAVTSERADLTAPGAISVEREGRDLTLVVDGWSDESRAALASAGASVVREDEMALEDIFVAVVKAAKRAGAP